MFNRDDSSWAAEYRRLVRRKFSYWIWALLGLFSIAGLVLFVLHHNQHEDRVEHTALKARMLSLKDIVPAAKNDINTQFILLNKHKTLEGQNKTCLALVADETAAVHFQFWGNECDAFEPGDIIHLTDGIFSYNRKKWALRAGKRGKVEKVGEFTMAYVETPNMSEIEWVHDPSQSKFVQKTVISPYSRIFPSIP